jgi:hypothetical protein
MTVANLYPDINPSLLLDFANVRALDPRITFTRASSAVVVDPTGVYREVTSNVPRFDYDPVTGESLGLLVEEQRTNGIRNPRGEGAVAGTPGTLPTNWNTSINSGLTREIIGVFTENGVVFTRLRLTGTVSGAVEALALNISPDINTLSGYTPGVAATFSMFLRLHAGSFPVSTSLQRLVIEERSTTTVLAFRTSIIQPTGSLQRFSYSFTAAAVGTTDARGSFWVYANAGVSVDFTIDIGWSQLELGAFATSPILPPENTIAQSTRLADSAVMTGTNFSSWYRPDEGTLLAHAKINHVGRGAFNNPAAPIALIRGTAVLRGISLDGLVDTTPSQLRFSSRTDTAFTSITTGSYVTGVYFKVAGSYDKNNLEKQATQNGNAPATPITLNALSLPEVQLLIGRDAINGPDWDRVRLNGHMRKLAYYPKQLTATQLQALTNL